MTLAEYLACQQSRIDRALRHWVPSESTPPKSIHKAMRYSLFAGGKRVRPILCLEAARAVSDSPRGIETAACLGINETTVRTRLYRAQRRLRIDWSQHAPAERSELLELKAQLRRAVEGENFELAAELRDRIRVLE